MPFKELDSLLQQVTASQRQQAERPRIVVVDDDLDMRRSLEVLLRDSYLVVLAASAAEGVATVDDDTCAVVLDMLEAAVRMHRVTLYNKKLVEGMLRGPPEDGGVTIAR